MKSIKHRLSLDGNIKWIQYDNLCYLWNAILEYTNAGHVPLYIRKLSHRIVKYAETHCTALGVFNQLSINSDIIQLDLGDEIILFTDGVTEAMSKNEVFYGYQRLENTLDELTISNPEHTANSIFKGVRKFSGESKQNDDITILIINFIHPKRKAST